MRNGGVCRERQRDESGEWSELIERVRSILLSTVSPILRMIHFISLIISVSLTLFPARLSCHALGFRCFCASRPFINDKGVDNHDEPWMNDECLKRQNANS